VTIAELHILCYVACLLALYRRRPTADWGYRFIRSPWGAPFSAELDVAVRSLCAGGLLTARNDIVTTTAEGREFVELLDAGEEHGWRTPFLEGACGSVLAIPIGSVRAALRQEPSLKRSAVHHEPRMLLGEAEDAALYEQFDAVGQVIGTEVADLMVPSVVWLTYLAELQTRAQLTPTSEASIENARGGGQLSE
jgi:hypothetical protein